MHTGPDINKNRLALSIDAANPKSFRGEPTTNLFTYSEEFNSGSWNIYRSTFTANSTYAPDGNLTADLFVWDGSNPNDCGYFYYPTWIANQTYTYSAYVKYYNSSAFFLNFLDRQGPYEGGTSAFNILDGTIITSSNCTPSITNVGNGWYRCSITFTITSSITFNYIQTGFTSLTIGQGGYIWGAQLELKSYATPYIKTTSTQGVRGTTVATGGGLKDLSQNNNSCTLLSTQQYSNQTKSLSFNRDNYINAGSINLNRDFSLEIWCKITGDTSGIFGQGIAGTNLGMHIFWHTYGGRGMVFGMYSNDLDTASYQMDFTTWHHFVFTYSNTTYVKEFYADGVKISNNTGTNYLGTGQFNIGATYSAGSTPILGNIAIANVHYKVLTANEILQNYESTKYRFKT